jgi:flavodoxin
MVLVLFATQTGNSELLAGEIAETLRESGVEAQVMDMADAYPELLEEVKHLIVPVCTWNDGTFPDNAVAFWEALTEVKPDCSGLAFGIVALGDRLYEPYYQVAAYRLADFLVARGAREAIEPFEIDGPVRSTHRRRLHIWTRACLRAFERAPAEEARG